MTRTGIYKNSKIQGNVDSNFHSESQLFTNIRLLNIHNCLQ